jgi:hypothetical protein
MIYRDMVLEAFDAAVERKTDKSRRGHFKVRVMRSPAGEMKIEEAAAVEYDDKVLQKALGELERRSLDRGGLIALGRLLGLLLLPPKREGAATGVRELLDGSPPPRHGRLFGARPADCRRSPRRTGRTG